MHDFPSITPIFMIYFKILKNDFMHHTEIPPIKPHFAFMCHILFILMKNESLSNTNNTVINPKTTT